MYTFNILLLSNRDSFDIGEQAHESMIFTEISVLMKNLGYAPDDFVIARRDLRNLIPNATQKTSAEELRPGAHRLLSGADLVLIAPSDDSAPGTDTSKRIQTVLELTKVFGVPVFTIGSHGDTGSSLLPWTITNTIRSITPSTTIGIVVGNGDYSDADVRSTQDLEFWKDIVNTCLQVGDEVKLFSNGEPSSELLVEALSSLVSETSVVVIGDFESQDSYIQTLMTCDVIVTLSFHASVIALANQITVFGVGSDIRFAELSVSLERNEALREALLFSTGILEVETLANVLQKPVRGLTQPLKDALIAPYQTLFRDLGPLLNPGHNHEPFTYEEFTRHAATLYPIDTRHFSKVRSKKLRLKQLL